ncbi:hypothetical protein ABPG75_003567 [Micractinium tetrahymenae]
MAASLEDVLGQAVEHVLLSPDGCTLPQLWGALGDAAAEAGVRLEAPAVRTALWRLLAAEPGIRAAEPSGRRVSGRGEAAQQNPLLASAEAAEQTGVKLTASQELQDAAVGLQDCQQARFSMSDTQRKALALIGTARRRGALQNDLATTLGVENRNFFYVVKVLEQRGLVVKHPLTIKRQSGRSHNSHVTTNILHLTRFAPPGVSKRSMLTDGRSQAHGGSGLAPSGGVAALGEDEVMVLDDETHFRRICTQLAACSGQQANETELKVVLGFRGTRGHRLWRRLRPLLVKRGHIEEFIAQTAADNKPVKCIKLVKPWKDEEGSEEESGDDEGGPPLGRQVAELSIDRQLIRELVAAGVGGVLVNDFGDGLRLNMKRNEPRLRELEVRFGMKRATVNQGRMITSRFTAPAALLHRFQDLVAPLNPAGGWLAAVAEAIEAGLDEGEPFPWPPQEGARPPLPLPAPQQGQAAGQQAQQAEQQEAAASELPGVEAAAATAVPTPAAVAAAAAAPDEGGQEPTPQPQQPLAAVPAGGAAPVVVLQPEGLTGGQTLAGRPSVLLKQSNFTEISERRLRWVIARISRAGFLLASELPRFLQEQEMAESGKKAIKPDRKTCDRIIERGMQQGLVQVLAINFPATYGGLSNRTHTVLAAPGTQQDEAFVEAVYQHYQSFKRRVHGNSGLSKRVAMQEREGKVIPVVDLKPLLPQQPKAAKKRKQRRRRASDSGEEEEEWEVEGDEALLPTRPASAARAAREAREAAAAAADAAAGVEEAGQHPQFVMPGRKDTVRIMQANGLQIWRMQRLRRMHEVCCQLAGLAGQRPGEAAPPGQPPECAAAAAEAGSVFMCAPLPGSEPGQLSRLVMTQVNLCENEDMARRVLTAKGVWHALTTQQFLYCVGSGSEDHAAVAELAASGRTLGSLSMEEMAVLCGGAPEIARAQTRLVQLFDLGYRMGILSLVLPVRSAGRTAVSSTADSLFLVEPKVVLQVPAPGPPPPQVIPVGTAGTAGAAREGSPSGEAGGVATPAPGAPLAPAAAAAAAGRLTLTFDLASGPDALGLYWGKMQHVVAHHATSRGVSTTKRALGRCFPFDRAPEATVERSWAYRKEVTREQMELLHAHLGTEEARGMSYERCVKVAAALGLPYEAVLAFSLEHDRPTQRLGRLAVARLGLDAVPNNAIERKRMTQRRHYWRRRLKDLQKRYPEGIPEEILQGRARGARGAAKKEGESAGKGKKRKARHGEDAGAALLPAEEEEEEEREEEAQVDQSALLPRPMPAPQRKKRWWRAEDRQLLTAWSGWMAVKGGRPILWRSTPGRPAGLKHYTLKRRLTQLQRNELLGSSLAEMQAVALHLHTLLAAREVREAEAREAAAAEAAAAEAAALQQAAPTPAAAAALAAVAAAAASKRKAASGAPDSPRTKKARRDEVSAAVAQAAQQAEEALAAGADAAAAGVAAARAMLEALLPSEVRREVKQGPEGPFPDAVHAVAQLAQLIEHVVALAPKQHKERGPGVRVGVSTGKRRPGPKPLSAHQQQQLRAGGGTQVAARPVALLRRWAAALRGAGGRGAGGTGAAAEQPSPAVTAAMAMAQSLLYMGADSGILGVGYETALTGRFSAPEILRAFELLQRQGALLPAAPHAQRHNFRLTEMWRATLQPSGFPSALFQEAASTANELSQRRRMDFAGREEAEGEEEEQGGLAAALAAPRAGGSARRHAQQELTGGAVAALLGGMAAGQVALRAHRVRAEPHLSAEEAIAVDSGGLQAHVAPLLVDVPVRASLAAPRHAVLAAGGSEGSAAGGERGGGTVAAAQAAAAAANLGAVGHEEAAGEVSSAAAAAGEAPPGGEGAGEVAGEGAPAPAESGGSAGEVPPSPAAKALGSLRFTHQDLVLFQPALVAVSAEARAAAEAACREAVTSIAGISSGGFDAAMGALRSAGSAGATRRQLGAALQAAGGAASAAGQLLEQLLLHGLARAICGFEGRRYAASEHSQCLLAFPHLPLPAAAELPAAVEQQGEQQAGRAQQAQQPDGQQLAQWRESFAREVRQLASRLDLPPSGQLQPCLDVPVRPWVDHHGRLNARLWEALVRKALAAAARHPGLAEDLLVEELSVLAPQHARELLRILVAGRVLKVQTARGAAPAAAPGGVLAACFGRGGGATVGSAGGEQQAQAGGAGGLDGGDDEGGQDTSGEGGEGAGAHAAHPRPQRFYSVLPGAAFGAARVLPPAALLPPPGALAAPAGAAGEQA